MRELLSPSVLLILAGLAITVVGGFLGNEPMIYGGLGLLGVGAGAKAVAARSPAKLVVLLPALLLLGCTGIEPNRLAIERANYTFAVRCADGWFGGLPFTADDVRVVRLALEQWRLAIEAEQALLSPVGSVPR